MALDRYKDSRGLTLVRRRYYEAAEVDTLLAESDRRIAGLRAENERLRSQLKQEEAQRDQVANAVLTTQEVCREIIDRANRQAADILEQAERNAQEIRERHQFRNEFAVDLVESCLRTVQRQQEAALETVKDAWQKYLCGLFPEGQEASPMAKHLAPDPFVPETAEPPAPPAEPEVPAGPEVPADLSEKVSAIARELEALEM